MVSGVFGDRGLTALLIVEQVRYKSPHKETKRMFVSQLSKQTLFKVLLFGTESVMTQLLKTAVCLAVDQKRSTNSASNQIVAVSPLVIPSIKLFTFLPITPNFILTYLIIPLSYLLSSFLLLYP